MNLMSCYTCNSAPIVLVYCNSADYTLRYYVFRTYGSLLPNEMQFGVNLIQTRCICDAKQRLDASRRPNKILDTRPQIWHHIFET